MLVPNNGTPLYEQLTATLMEKITSGEYAPGAKLMPETDMCGYYGISRSTLRQALLELEKKGYITRRRGMGTFVSSAAVKGELGRWIGVVGTELHNPLVQKVVRGVESVLAGKGFDIRFFQCFDDPQETERMVGWAAGSGAAGLLIYPAEDTSYSAELAGLRDGGYPFCLFDRALLNLMTDCAMTDNLTAGELITSHLIAKGHRRIAYVSHSSRETYTVRERYQGYVTAHIKSKLPLDPRLTITGACRENNWVCDLRKLLESEIRPEAIVAVNDFRAMEVIQFAMALGIRVPEDLAVVGFDNQEIGERFIVPLTTMEQPFEDIGVAAARLLLDRMDRKPADYRWIYGKPKLIVRKSCGGSA